MVESKIPVVQIWMWSIAMRKVLFVVVVLTFAVAFTTFVPAEKIGAVGNLKVERAFERTPEQMDAFDATMAAPASREVPFRPTIDESVYRQMKQAAMQRAAQSARPNPGPS